MQAGPSEPRRIKREPSSSPAGFKREHAEPPNSEGGDQKRLRTDRSLGQGLSGVSQPGVGKRNVYFPAARWL